MTSALLSLAFLLFLLSPAWGERTGEGVAHDLGAPSPNLSPSGREELDVVLALHRLQHFLAQSGGGVGDPDACRTHGVDLELGGVLATGDHRACMAHAAA